MPEFCHGAGVGVVIGTEALAAGEVTRYALSADFRRLLPGVYAPRRMQLTLADRITAAWLWSRRDGVIMGSAAAAMHGAAWVDRDIPIEMNLARDKSPAGIIVRRDALCDDEVVRRGGIAVTTVARTAFDLARHGSIGGALERLDALARARPFSADDVLAVRDRHPRVRGRRRVPAVLDLIDAGAQSPKETWLRLLLIDAGFPRPQTQIPVRDHDGVPMYYLDMGWEEFMVAAEYDGQQHRTDTRQYGRDVLRSEYLDSLGWRRVRVLAGHRRDDIVRRVSRAGVPRNRP